MTAPQQHARPFSVPQVAERWGCSEGLVRKLIRSGELACFRPGTLIRIAAAEAGVPMAELAQFMGHDDDRTTQQHYARFSPDHLRGVADRIGAVA